MSHELRTPLNAILGFSEVMKSELFGPHAIDAYRDYSNDIHTSGQHLLMLINEILDLSRVEAGRYELKEEAVLLAGVIEDCRHLLTLRAKKRGVTMSEIIEPNMPRIWADERAMRQIALNLLTNAIKFTPQGGQVTIKVGWTMRRRAIFLGQGHRPRHSRRGNPGHHVLVRTRLDGPEKRRRGQRPRPADRQGAGRAARRQSSPCARGCARARKSSSCSRPSA